MKNILVVGSGSAGLIAATILKKRLNVQVDVLSSSGLDIIGVGEGSTTEFFEYMKFIGITDSDIIKNCGATYKSGIMFEGWNDKKDFLHTASVDFFSTWGQYYHAMAKQISDESDFVCPQHFYNNALDEQYVFDNIRRVKHHPQITQYHFDSYKLNKFLIDISKGMGINFIDDKIQKVNLSDDGNIKTLMGEVDEYDYDFYIDATGFKKILIGEMGAEWKSYGKYLKMNSAITFETEQEDNYNIWTLSKAMDAGWLFRIPVQGRYGNGYIFDDNYIDEEQAKVEVEKYFGKEIKVGKKFKFDPGCLDKSWIKNCCAIGLSSSFIEPLEATSIGSSIQQTFMLMQKLPNYNEVVIESYNKSFDSLMENLRDFVVMHYVTNKTNTQFWKDVSKLELPKTLKDRLELWKHKMPVSEDMIEESDYTLFKEYHYIIVMHGLGLFDTKSITEEFNMHSDELKEDAIKVVDRLVEMEKTTHLMKHIDAINLISNAR
jgi:flavin-dependent dehydrogenase